MQMRSNTSSAARIMWLSFLALAITLAGCSSSSDDEAQTTEKDTSEDASLAIPEECDDAKADGVTSAECDRAMFAQLLASDEYPELAELTSEQTMAFARGLCDYGTAISTGAAADKPRFGDLVASTATSWAVEPKVVEGIYRSTRLLCPDGYAALESLPRSTDGISLEYRVAGKGSGSVSYSLSDGSTQRADVTAPWTQVVHLQRPENVTMTVTPDGDGEIGCVIAVNGQILDEAGSIEGRPATCEVSENLIDTTLVGE